MSSTASRRRGEPLFALGALVFAGVDGIRRSPFARAANVAAMSAAERTTAGSASPAIARRGARGACPRPRPGNGSARPISTPISATSAGDRHAGRPRRGRAVPALRRNLLTGVLWMKRLLLAIFCLLPLAARGASPEEDYFASRDQYIANFKSIEDGRSTTPHMHVMTPRSPTSGSSPPGSSGRLRCKASPPRESRPRHLFPSDEGFGSSTAWPMRRRTRRRVVLVTTAGLLAHWLKDTRTGAEGFRRSHRSKADAALQSEVFYSRPSAPTRRSPSYAAIPVTKPSAAKFAVALPRRPSQDVVPLVPDELLVSIVTGDRVFVVDAPAEGKITGIAACDKVWQDFEKRADEADQAYMASDPKDPKLLDAYNRIQQEGSGAFGRCFGERAPHNRSSRPWSSRRKPSPTACRRSERRS